MKYLGFLFVLFISLIPSAWAGQTNNPSNGIPQPVVNGQCIIGSGGSAVWGSCSGSGTSVSSVSGDSVLFSNSASTGAVTLVQANAGAKTLFGNATTGSTTPSFLTAPVVSGIMTASGFTSTVATGTAPIIVASTTNVANLNASSLSGATFAAPGTIGGGTPAAATFTTLTGSSTITFSGISGSTQCLHVNTSGVVTGTGSDCGAGSSAAFNALTSGTNTTAAMVVGSGGTLGVSGSGTIAATSAPLSGISGLGTGVATFLGTPSSANLATALTDETGTGVAVFSASPTLTGTLTAAAITASGTATLSGISGQTQCLHVNSSGVISGTGNDCGIGTLSITDGTHTISNSTVLTFGNGFVVGGSGTSATLNTSVADTTHATSATISNVGGQDNYNGSSITATIPGTGTMGTGQTATVTNYNASTLTLSNSQTINGLPLATSLHTGGFYNYTGNGTTADAYGFPGFGTIATNALGKFVDGTGAEGASTVNDAGSGVTIGSPTGGAEGAGTLNATGLYAAGVQLQNGNFTQGTNMTITGTWPNLTFAAAGGGSGCSTSGANHNILTDNGSGGCSSDTNANLTAGALSLGASGTAGSIAMGNATTGTITLQPVTGALGSVTVSIPAATDTLVNLAGTQTLSNKTFVAPALGTPASGVATNITGLPISTGISGLATGIATFLGTPSSANLAAALTDETGSGAAVFATSPTLVTPALGTPSAVVLTNATGTAASLTAGTATNATNVATTATTTNAVYFPMLAPSASSSNQATNTSATFAINASTKYVGIGTNAPAVLLDIQGADNNSLQLSSTNTSGTAITINNSTSGAHNYQFFTTGSLANVGQFGFYDVTSNRTTFAMYGGDVGGTHNFTQAIKFSGATSLGWTAVASNAIGTLDTAMSRDSANVIDFGTGAGDTSGTIQMQTINAGGTIKQGTVLSCATGLTTNSGGSINGCVASDPSLKKNMKSLAFDDSLIDRLHPILYDWKDPSKYDGKTHAGFNAREVDAIFPEATKSAGKDLLGIDNSALDGAIVLDLQNAHKTIKSQENKIKALNARLEKLECKIDKHCVK